MWRKRVRVASECDTELVADVVLLRSMSCVECNGSVAVY